MYRFPMRILAGRFKGRALPVPASARPAGARLRTSLFSVLGASLEGQRVLDVCAGAGGFGLEALSRGAARVTLLERDPQALRELAAWLEKVGAAADADVVRLDVLRTPWPPGPYDLVLLDPPFEVWPPSRTGRVARRGCCSTAPARCLPLGGGWW